MALRELSLWKSGDGGRAATVEEPRLWKSRDCGRAATVEERPFRAA